MADSGLGLRVDDMLAALELLSASTAKQAFAQAKDELAALIRLKGLAVPLLRLAWTEAASFSRQDSLGGARGWSRSAPSPAQQALEGVHVHYPSLSWADLLQLAGLVALSELGGPSLSFRWGRLDVTEAPPARLPDRSRPDLCRSLVAQWGLLEREVVALFPLLGLAEADWTLRSDYFATLVERKVLSLLLPTPLPSHSLQWTEVASSSPLQYVDESGTRRLQAADLALLTDAALAAHAQRYARSEEAWRQDLGSAFQRLQELGHPLLHRLD